ncbi:MAG: MarR family transcriptional regulator [Clostridia bacterium]|nr:MarR family transcriptional regulator [Clostridia bacterium]
MATFLKNINMISNSAARFLEQELPPHVKGWQSKYVLCVCSNPGITQDGIAKEIFVNKSNVSRQVAALEEAGLFRREADSEDSRVSHIYPTEKAMELREEIRTANARWREIITEGLSPDEKEELYRLTSILYENAEKYMNGGSKS